MHFCNRNKTCHFYCGNLWMHFLSSSTKPTNLSWMHVLSKNKTLSVCPGSIFFSFTRINYCMYCYHKSPKFLQSSSTAILRLSVPPKTNVMQWQLIGRALFGFQPPLRRYCLALSQLFIHTMARYHGLMHVV